MKIYYQNRAKTFRQELVSEISVLIRQQGEKSEFRDEQVLKVKDVHSFELSGGRDLAEISSTELIDNNGYSYNYDVLTIEQLCEIVDSF